MYTLMFLITLVIEMETIMGNILHGLCENCCTMIHNDYPKRFPEIIFHRTASDQLSSRKIQRTSKNSTITGIVDHVTDITHLIWNFDYSVS